MAKTGGKGSRARTRERRVQERRARKQYMNAQYAKWSADGQNSKSKRARLKVQETVVVSAIRAPRPTGKSWDSMVKFKLLELAGYSNQHTTRYGKELSSFIKSNFKNIEAAWEHYNIVPKRVTRVKGYTHV